MFQISFDYGMSNKTYSVNATRQLNYNLTMSDLTPGVNYTVSVVAVREEAKSSPKSVQGLTGNLVLAVFIIQYFYKTVVDIVILNGLNKKCMKYF